MACTYYSSSNQCHGPGYPSPLDAFRYGPKEKIMYLTTVGLNGSPDSLVVVDLDSESKSYGKIVAKLAMPFVGDELHHFGWNSCSSCFKEADCVRDKIILPCLNSSRIYVVQVDSKTGHDLKIVKIIDDLSSSLKVSAPHTVHCAPDKSILVSCMGDENGMGKGSIIKIDAKDFNTKNFWTSDYTDFAYDFWYQPRHNVLISTEWGSPNAWKKGLDLTDLTNGQYGHSIHIYEWSSGKKLETIDLGEDGLMPLEVRFMHNPEKSHAFVGCALSSTIFHIFLNGQSKWKAEKIIQIENKRVRNWILELMPAVITDIILSMDDKFLYFSNWIQGDIRQYDVTIPSCPVLKSRIFLGGSLCNDSKIEIISDERDREVEDHLVVRPKIKDKFLRGGPQMLQLSLDGQRLYVTNSLYSAWDRQFYPDLADHGAMMVKIDVDHKNGSMKLDKGFLVDFGDHEDGPMLAHEMRYPDGDCTSDIWC